MRKSLQVIRTWLCSLRLWCFLLYKLRGLWWVLFIYCFLLVHFLCRFQSLDAQDNMRSFYWLLFLFKKHNTSSRLSIFYTIRYTFLNYIVSSLANTGQEPPKRLKKGSTLDAPGFPQVEPLMTFDWEKAEPLKIRPFKPKYHLTMCMELAISYPLYYRCYRQYSINPASESEPVTYLSLFTIN